MKQLLFYLFFLPLLFSGCGPRLHIDSVFSHKTLGDTWKEHEAKLSDIPILLTATHKSCSFDEAAHILTVQYQTKDTKQSVVSNYEKQLEYYGWRRIADFLSDSGVLIFEKPTKQIAVHIKSQQNAQVFVELMIKYL